MDLAIIIFILLLILIFVFIILIVYWHKNNDNCNTNDNNDGKTNYLFLSSLRSSSRILVVSPNIRNKDYAERYGYDFDVDIHTENKELYSTYDYIFFINSNITVSTKAMSPDRIIYLSEGTDYIFVTKEDQQTLNKDIFLFKINNKMIDDFDIIIQGEYSLSDMTKTQYDNGYFYIGDKISVFPSQSFTLTYDTNIHGSIHDPIRYTIVKKHIKSNVNRQDIKSSSETVVRRAVQIFETLAVPNFLIPSINSLILKHPNFDYYYSTKRDVIVTLKQLSKGDKFYARIYSAYKKLIPGAYRADLWRLVYLYLYGGMYADIKMFFINSIDNIVPNLGERDMVLCFDRNGRDIYNAFLYSKPDNKLFKILIKKICKNIETDYYGNDTLEITGPKMIKYVFDDLKLNLKLGINDTKYGKIEMLVFKDDDLGHTIKNSKDEILSYIRQPRSSLKMQAREMKIATGMVHYGQLWSNRQVYR
jgi:mannosyltransferase OCH1-like enzyme